MKTVSYNIVSCLNLFMETMESLGSAPGVLVTLKLEFSKLKVNESHLFRSC